MKQFIPSSTVRQTVTSKLCVAGIRQHCSTNMCRNLIRYYGGQVPPRYL